LGSVDLVQRLTAADTISPDRQEVSGREGQSVTLSCSYQTDSSGVYLYWYRHHSDLQAPQFILWKGAKSDSAYEHIPDGRYGSQTTASSTTLSIPKLTLADTALYYCALRHSDPKSD
uniref:Ig-like domain-containing protein n=1 Tax=Salarias fasciatus TaxID=181472 RepID=A0A672HFD8_SALFA